MAVDECWIAAVPQNPTQLVQVPVSMASKVEVNLVLPELKSRCIDYIDMYWDLTSHAAEMKTTGVASVKAAQGRDLV